MSAIAQLIIEQGRQAAEARAARGQIWGRAVENISAIPGQVMAQQRQQQELGMQKQELGARLALQGQEGQLNQEKLDQLKEAKQAEQATASLVAKHTTVDPASGIPTTDHQAVAQGLLQINPKFASAYMADAEARDQHATTIQKAHLDLQKEQNTYYADRIGPVANSPPEEFDARFAVLKGWADVAAKGNPVLGNLPTTQTGLKQLHDQLLGEAANNAQAVQAASLRSASLKEIQKEGTLIDINQIDPTTGKPKVIAGGAPADKHLESKDVLLDNKPAKVTFDPATGKSTDATGADVSARVKPIPSQAAVNVVQQTSDAKDIADGIEAGLQPPDIKGLYRNAAPVRAELARRGYDLTTANLDWQATQKHVATLNGQQQTRLRQAISTASQSLDVIDELAKKWDAGQFPILNKANLALAKNGAYGKEAASIATQLDGQITDVTSELGNVYMGGNSPTDHALQLAGKNLSANWDKKVLLDMTNLARTNLKIRNNSMVNVGMAGLSTAVDIVSPPVAAPATAPRVYYDMSGKRIAAQTGR